MRFELTFSFLRKVFYQLNYNAILVSYERFELSIVMKNILKPIHLKRIRIFQQSDILVADMGIEPTSLGYEPMLEPLQSNPLSFKLLNFGVVKGTRTLNTLIHNQVSLPIGLLPPYLSHV